MKTSYEQLERFFRACDDFMNENYMLADLKISEILKSIAESRALTDLFSAVTDRFNYTAAKEAYLKYPATAGSSHGIIYLPKDRSELLAFVFCILADIDAGRMKFDDFLLRYFYEDGSYTASFALFAQRIVRPFADIVKESFPDVVRNDSARAFQQRQNELLSGISCQAVEERRRLLLLKLSEEDISCGQIILNELIAAAGKGYTSEVKALLAGYLCFMRCLSLDGADELFRLGGELN